MSLLEKARAHRPKTVRSVQPRFNNHELEELGLAWIKGEVQYAQVSKALRTTGSSVYSLVFTALRRAIDDGRLKVSVKK